MTSIGVAVLMWRYSHDNISIHINTQTYALLGYVQKIRGHQAEHVRFHDVRGIERTDGMQDNHREEKVKVKTSAP